MTPLANGYKTVAPARILSGVGDSSWPSTLPRYYTALSKVRKVHHSGKFDHPDIVRRANQTDHRCHWSEERCTYYRHSSRSGSLKSRRWAAAAEVAPVEAVLEAGVVLEVEAVLEAGVVLEAAAVLEAEAVLEEEAVLEMMHRH